MRSLPTTLRLILEPRAQVSGATSATARAEAGSRAPRRPRHVDLGRAAPAVFEQDRRLTDPAADRLAPEQNLFLERVAARPDLRQVNLGELADAVTPECAAVVVAGQTEDQPGIAVDSGAHKSALEGEPALDSAAGNIPRANHDVVAGHSTEQVGDEAGRMAEVGVEVDQVIEVVFDRDRIAASVAVPRPSLPGRCITSIFGSVSCSSSAIRPVPSGELSSMIRIEPCGANWRIVSTNGRRLPASL